MDGDTQGNLKGGAALGPQWTPMLWVIAASALAHLWCLGSQFYMDDMTAIRDNEAIRNGVFWAFTTNIWTNLGYVIQYKLFGMNPVAFHAVNWLLHATIACVIFGFGRDFLRGRAPAGVALFAALLFAVHPLASEIPNYARTQDLAWVTLFSLLASWSLLRFLQDGTWRNLLWMAAGIIGATISKGPGLFHAVMMTGVVGLAFATPAHWNLLRRRIAWVAGSALLGLAVLWLIGLFPHLLATFERWNEPRFIGHAYTLVRVFWEFAWRGVIPVALCSDHLIAESLVPPGSGWLNIPDKAAMWAAAALLALTALSVFLAWRKPTRLFGICLFLFIGTILFRVTYVMPEYMPEYRIYPGMPWFCLGAAILLGALWNRIPGAGSPRFVAALILLPCIVLSAKRSFVWHDLDRLTGDVLTRYPAHARVLWELNDRDLAKGNWQAIIHRQTTMWPEIERQFVRQNQQLAPAREIPSGHFVLALVAIHGGYARALGHTQNPATGLHLMAQLEAHMKLMQMTPETKPLEWGYFYHDKALLLEMAGNPTAAAELLRRKEVPPFWPHDLQRVEKK